MFTKNQIQEIGKKLGLFGKKDTDFEDAKLPLSGEEYVVLVQNGKNVKTKVKNLGVNFQPDDPNDPENPGEPSDPNEPNEPDTPDIPDVPDVPDEPDIPDTPDDPDVPSISDVIINITPTSLSDISDDGETRTLTVEYKYAKVIDGYVLNPISTNWISLELTNVEDKPSEYTIKYIYNVTVYPNENTNTRSAEIKFGAIGINDSTKLVSCKVNQLGQPKADVSITFEPSTINFNYDEANVTKEFIGTFVNCAPISGVSDNDVVIEYIETLGGGKYKFTAKVLKSNNSSKNITYTGRIQYKDTLGYTAYKTIPIIVNKAPSATITLTPSNLTVPYNGSNNTISIVTKNSKEDTLKAGALPYDWITIEKSSSNMFTVTTAENPYNKQRSANVQFYVTGLDGVEKGATLQITQWANPNVTEEDETPMMYRGYLNADLVNEFALGASGVSKIYENVTADVLNRGIEMGIIVKEPLEEKGKTAFPDIPKSTILIFAIPHSSSMNVYKDDGIGNPIAFSHSQLNVNGETVVIIGNEAYRLYGEYQSIDIINGSQSYYIK